MLDSNVTIMVRLKGGGANPLSIKGSRGQSPQVYKMDGSYILPYGPDEVRMRNLAVRLG